MNPSLMAQPLSNLAYDRLPDWMRSRSTVTHSRFLESVMWLNDMTFDQIAFWELLDRTMPSPLKGES